METQLVNPRELNWTSRLRSVAKRSSGVFMLLCCMLPITALLLLPIVGVSLGNGARIVIVLLCPVSHVLMIRFLHRRSHGENGGRSVADHGSHKRVGPLGGRSCRAATGEFQA